MKKIHEKISTIFGLGYFPVAPGTVGSLAGLILCLLLHKYVLFYALTFVVLFALGVVSSGKVEKEKDLKDPPFIIIDEFACIFLVFFLIPLTPARVVIGFIIYRVIDILKPPPGRSLEKLKGGWGVMLDDAMAAIYTNLLLHIWDRFSSL
jgi:phosphatidylglycerophosphatase A